MNCPKCQAAMESVTYEGVEIDRCTGCKGLWFDLLEAEDLKKLHAGKVIDIGSAATGKRLDDKREIECPKCETQMVKLVVANQPEIRYEACSACYGVFFDAGEFAAQEKSAIGALKGLMAGLRKP